MSESEAFYPNAPMRLFVWAVECHALDTTEFRSAVKQWHPGRYYISAYGEQGQAIDWVQNTPEVPGTYVERQVRQVTRQSPPTSSTEWQVVAP